MNIDKDYLVRITQKLYRLTILFPKKEPLRYKMREVADDILAVLIFRFTGKNFRQFENPDGYFEVLDGFFDIAKVQNWVRSDDVLELSQEYGNLRSALQSIESEGETLAIEMPSSNRKIEIQPPTEDVSRVFSLKSNLERREKILDFLRESGRVQVWQVKQILPDVSKRTLRRDFEQMLSQGLVERMGEKNNTFYQLKLGVIG